MTSSPLSQQEAARLLLERRQARSSLLSFAKTVFRYRRGYDWQEARHHLLICDALEKVFHGEIKRLIINIPPRYSKTELVKSFIAWSLGHAPDSEFIYTSYSGRLAAASSWDVRGLIQEPIYQAIFGGLALREDSQAKDEWRTTAGGIMYAVGAGGTITGYGAGKHRPGFGGALLIDDPHKADEARSDVMRQNVIDWFQNTFESRKNSPDTPIILIMQRLHESDLAGWLLAGGNGERWEHVCLPALQDDGSALWPEKHSVEELRRMEAASPYTFAGQYQQRPAPAEGGIFKPDQIQVIDALPYGHIQWVRGWDLASTTDGDFTAGGKVGRLPDGRFVIGDMVRLRVGPDERDAAMVNTASLDGVSTKVSIPQDPGQAGKTQVLYLTRELVGYPVTTSPESGDKVTRAEPFAAQVNVGNVVMLRGSWNNALIDEMRMFPNGSFDDQIDSLSRAFSHLIGGGLAQWAALAS
jgi:predicted phage terminase large subunit-like protein